MNKKGLKWLCIGNNYYYTCLINCVKISSVFKQHLQNKRIRLKQYVRCYLNRVSMIYKVKIKFIMIHVSL